MERKLAGKFGYTSRGCPLFWKCRKIVITGAVNQKMLFYSLLEVVGNSNRKFWLNGKRPRFPFAPRYWLLPGTRREGTVIGGGGGGAGGQMNQG